MYGSVIDILVLVFITSLLARQRMDDLLDDDPYSLPLFGLGLMALGLMLSFEHAHVAVAVAVYLAVLLPGFRSVLGTTWLGAVVGAVGFILYKLCMALSE